VPEPRAGGGDVPARSGVSGKSGAPEVVAETEGLIVVDPHIEPPPEEAPELHFVFVVEDERIVEMRNYPDRRAALDAVGL
jgi:hypothetical protein